VSSVWVPTYGHPRGASPEPWFVVDEAGGRRADGHPEGPSDDVVFRVEQDVVYPVDLPDRPRFEIVGSFVYHIESGGAPWYWVRPAYAAA
jgi:hypothetical protein